MHGLRGLLGWILICCGVALLVFTISGIAHAQTLLMPPPRVQFFSGAVPVAGGCVGTFSSGTNTPLATFTDSTGVTANTNPVTLDANGMAPIWLLSTSTYRIVVSQAPSFPFTCATGPGPQLYLVDGVVGVGGGSGGGSGGLLASNNTWTGTNLWTATSTFNGALVAPKIGPAVGQQHTLPAVASDTIALLAATQTFTNKTLTSPTITGGNINNTTLSNPTIGSIPMPSPGTFAILNNDGTTGTAVNTLTSETGSAQFIKTSAGATGGVLGVCILNCAIGGTGTVQFTGSVQCQFDGSTTNNDYVQISSTTAGNCHDTGSTSYPQNGGQIIGRVASGGVGAGLYVMYLFSPEIQPPALLQTHSVDLTTQGANIALTTIFTPSANGFFDFQCYTVVTRAATSTSTLPSCNVSFTGADTGVNQGCFALSTQAGNVVGTQGNNSTGGAAETGCRIYAASGVPIQYQTLSYASSGATSMQYAIHIRVIGPY